MEAVTIEVDDNTSLSYKRRELARVLNRWLGNVPTEGIRRGYAALKATGVVDFDAVNRALGA